MTGRVRRRTRPQGDREIFREQRNFGGGLNSELPSTELNNNELPVMENFIAHERFLEGRSGSVDSGRTLDGTGSTEVHSIKYNPFDNHAYYHQGLEIFADSFELKDFDGVGFGLTGPSQIHKWKDGNMILFHQSGMYLLAKFGVPFFFKMNGTASEVPGAPPLTVGSVSGAVKKYKYAATYSTIIKTDGTISTTGDRFTSGQSIYHETPPVLIEDSSTELFYVLHEAVDAIDAVNTATIDLNTAVDNNSQPHTSHITLYRTLDLGIDGLNIFEGQAAGNRFSDDYIWVADYTTAAAGSNVTDNTTDAVLTNRLQAAATTPDTGYLLKTIGWKGINADNGKDGIGAVTRGFVFFGERGSERVQYSQRNFNDINTGYHHAGFQYHDFNDSVNQFGVSPDILSIFCDTSTPYCVLTAIDFQLSPGVNILSHYDDGDRVIGVRDFNSVAEVEQGTFLAVCSDSSVRLWNGASWGRDLADSRVKSTVSTMVKGITVGFYYKGAYLLWFTDDSTNTDPTRMLRLSLKSESGRGWTEYTGTNMILPFSSPCVYVGDRPSNSDSATGLNLLFIAERVTGKIYWIETFDGPDTITMNTLAIKKYYADKVTILTVGTDIPCKGRIKAITGSRESFNIIHKESHIYTRTVTTPKVRPDLSIDMAAYVDDAVSAVESVIGVDPDGDIHFWRDISGRQIEIEFTTNRSGVKIVGWDHLFRVQDVSHPSKNSFSSPANTFQDEIMSVLFLHFAVRPIPFLDRVSAGKIQSTNINTITAPDLRSLGIQTGSLVNAVFTPTYSTSATIFSSFWIKTSSFIGGDVQIFTLAASDSGSAMTVKFTNATTIDLDGTTITVDDITAAGASVNGWHHFYVAFPGFTASAVDEIIQETGSADDDIEETGSQPDVIDEGATGSAAVTATQLTVIQNKVLKGTSATSSFYGNGSVTVGSTGSGTVYLSDLRIGTTDILFSADTDSVGLNTAAYHYDDVKDNEGKSTLPFG